MLKRMFHLGDSEDFMSLGVKLAELDGGMHLMPTMCYVRKHKVETIIV